MPAPIAPPDVRLERLPLVTLYLTERCNSRCVTCDYWRHGRIDMSLELVAALLPQLRALQTQVVLVSGGEPLLHPEAIQIAELLRAQGLKLWLLSSGLSLAKHANAVGRLFDRVTVSLDGTNPATYAAIRGLDAFDKVCEGIRAVVPTSGVGLRVTLQQRNFRELLDFVRTGERLGVQEVSFLAVDVANPHAFARQDDYRSDLALKHEDLPEFAALLDRLEKEHADAFTRGFIAESPQKLRRIHEYFAAVCGRGSFPAVRCNAPQFSAVVCADGSVQPCFFIPAPPESRVRDSLAGVLNSPQMLGLRRAIQDQQRAECRTCVCSMWRDAERDLTARELMKPHRLREPATS
jgi:Fe-coproporphyrin III synthase